MLAVKPGHLSLIPSTDGKAEQGWGLCSPNAEEAQVDGALGLAAPPNQLKGNVPSSVRDPASKTKAESNLAST